jgi:hypothetical protein
MLPEVRLAVVALGLIAAAVAGFFAYRLTAANAFVLKSWTKMPATVRAMPAWDHVEIELPGDDPDPNTLVLAPTHSLGLALNKKVPVYVDPRDPKHAQFGGLLQMWLWPAALAMGAAVFLVFAITFARAGSGETGDGWRISAPPPARDTDIRVRPPASESRAPLFWSLLGFAALASSILSRSAPIAARAGLAILGSLFMLAMWAKSLENRSTQIRADSQRIRKSSAFGWIEGPWDRIASVERIEVIPDERTPGFNLYRALPFPGRSVESFVFLDPNGRTLFTMSPAMGPMDPMHRLLNLCREKTGSTLERKTIRAPIF